jgi:hypothetical protein
MGPQDRGLGLMGGGVTVDLSRSNVTGSYDAILCETGRTTAVFGGDASWTSRCVGTPRGPTGQRVSESGSVRLPGLAAKFS